jgi:sugar transferase (PEP-CTERM/EpsH1 system associated)
VVHSFAAGGLENGLVNIINGSPQDLCHELCLLTKSDDFLQRLNREVAVHSLNKRPGHDWVVLSKILEIIWRRRIDLVHTRNWAAFDGVVAALPLVRVGVIHSEHGRDLQDPDGLNKRRNLLRRLMQFRVSRFVAVSADLLGWLSEVVRIAPGKLQLIPNGVDTLRFCPTRRPQLRAQLEITPDDFVVGSVGRLDPVKNHEGLIRSVHLLQQRGLRARLVIVGDGPNRQRLEGLVGSLSWISAPVLLGNQMEVETLYGMFDVYVLNSFAEGMSNTLLEAMASGLPTVCTRAGGNSELIQDERTGKLIPIGDDEALSAKLAEYQASAELRHEHGSLARKFVEEHHSLNRMVGQYVDLYQSVLRA